MGESKIMINKKVISNQKSEFTITVGKHTASVSRFTVNRLIRLLAYFEV